MSQTIENIIKAWPEKASVTRWKPVFARGPEYDYPLSVLPVRKEELDALDEQTRRAVALSLWIQYNRRTIDAEDWIANPAIDFLLRLDLLTPSLKIALQQTAVDERYHTYLHTLALNEALSRCKITPPFVRSVTVREMMERMESCGIQWQKDFVQVAYAAVAEVSVNAFLEILSKSPEIPESNRALVAMHNLDERFHTSVFIEVVKHLVPILPDAQAKFLIAEIERASDSFLKHDFSMYRSVIAAHGVELELITSNPSMSRDLSGVTRLIESVKRVC
jgi:hypothetical protein